MDVGVIFHGDAKIINAINELLYLRLGGEYSWVRRYLFYLYLSSADTHTHVAESVYNLVILCAPFIYNWTDVISEWH